MSQTLAIAAGGAIGALMRYWMSIWVYAKLGSDFPYGTLAVNVLGSLIMGVLYVLLVERLDLDPIWRAALLVGLLGAFTTFSAFSIETLNLIESRENIKALLNIFFSVVLCIFAAWAGVIAGRNI